MTKTAFVIDFDDTLAHTDSKVKVVKKNGDVLDLTPYEYAQYDKEEGDELDYSDFEKLVNPKPIPRFVNLLKTVIFEKKADKVVILTARGNPQPVAKFLKLVGITTGVKIKAIGDSNPLKKSEFVENLIKDGYTKVLFIDDAPKNIKAVSKLKNTHPEAKIIVHQVKKGSADTGDVMSKLDTTDTTQKPKKSDEDPVDRDYIKNYLNHKIKNPLTGNSILVKTALKYDKSNKARIAAVQYIKTRNN